MQPPKNLKFAFDGSGRIPQEDQPEQGLFSAFKAAVSSVALAIQGPDICERLKTQKESLIAANTVNGTARDVKTHFALRAMIQTVDNLTKEIHNGGTEGMEAATKAQAYLAQLQKSGLGL